ncbi:MAG: hypothetical protein CL946_08385 [Ectothiorhodospiraceae bacterium]|nr:hypothetical protein [Ectothiorhodospiraceae bacterium]
MEKNNYPLFEEILKRLDDNGILDHVVVVGSWAIYLYTEYFRSTDYYPAIRTRDVDFLLQVPSRISSKRNFSEIIEDLGFVEELVGDEGYTRYSHPDLIIEFLVKEKGRGYSKPPYIEKLGVTPQPLRFLDMLESGRQKVSFNGMSVMVPHPANFALHKLLISARRSESYKSENDRRQALKLIDDLVDNNDSDSLSSVFNSLPARW